MAGRGRTKRSCAASASASSSPTRVRVQLLTRSYPARARWTVLPRPTRTHRCSVSAGPGCPAPQPGLAAFPVGAGGFGGRLLEERRRCHGTWLPGRCAGNECAGLNTRCTYVGRSPRGTHQRRQRRSPYLVAAPSMPPARCAAEAVAAGRVPAARPRAPGPWRLRRRSSTGHVGRRSEHSKMPNGMQLLPN